MRPQKDTFIFQLGSAGSVHDSRMLRCSSLKTDWPSFFSTDQYVLGDSAYGTNFPYVVSPYKKPLSNVLSNKSFNYLLSKSRIRIEHSICVLKECFPRLRDGFTDIIRDDQDNKFICNTIPSSIVLHYICLIMKDKDFSYIIDDGEFVIL